MRCSWVPENDPLYVRYHDEEWGRPATTESSIFEKLSLEVFQSGLSWITILRKRDSLRKSFKDFDVNSIALLDSRAIEELLTDATIIRHKGKIEAVINNAKCVQMMRCEVELIQWFWSWAEQQLNLGEPIAQTDRAIELANTLKMRGWKFIGPKTVYAFMQTEGLVNDHEPCCIAFDDCEKLRQTQVAALNS